MVQPAGTRTDEMAEWTARRVSHVRIRSLVRARERKNTRADGIEMFGEEPNTTPHEVCSCPLKVFSDSVVHERFAHDASRVVSVDFSTADDKDPDRMRL